MARSPDPPGAGRPLHDALFRRLLSDPAIAAAVLSKTLPPEVAAAIDFATLTPATTSHVDEALHAFHSDVVFSARIAGREARLLLLLAVPILSTQLPGAALIMLRTTWLLRTPLNARYLRSLRSTWSPCATKNLLPPISSRTSES